MSSSVIVTATVEAAHRIPHLGGKCVNLHGHSWQVEVTISAPELHGSVVVEFGAVKAGLRGWLEANLDHGVMLGADDPLCPVLLAAGKVFRFGASDPRSDAERLARDLAAPTVENVAVLVARVAADVLDDLPAAGEATVSRVRVRETAANSAEWTP